MKHFNLVDGTDETSVYERKFSGRLTRKRYKLLDSLTRKRSYRENCGHEWDCCGCVFAVCYSFVYRNNQVIVRMVQFRNY